ncbi:hypothetical protein BLE401_17015 [Beggiatoa leptomitoformis]|uniref:Uncharacterized protein n=1 Tax=Beggiatoa leptomitoformis TaxID=288004 RepID=A0A2N9YI78_9GAMM|nr:hypothetical protein BLE401_17015 [Beggiatoa leptomitoformis]
MMYILFFLLVSIGVLTIFLYKRKVQRLEQERREKEMWLMQEIAIQQVKKKKAEDAQKATVQSATPPEKPTAKSVPNKKPSI